MATTGLKHQKNPIGKRKEDLVRDPRNKVKEKGHQDVSAPGPDGMEENIFRPKIWTKEKKLSEVKLAYQNLTNKLLKKSGISAEDMSQGMKQLEEMMANIFFLMTRYRRKRNVPVWRMAGRRAATCPVDG